MLLVLTAHVALFICPQGFLISACEKYEAEFGKKNGDKKKEAEKDDGLGVSFPHQPFPPTTQGPLHVFLFLC